MPFLNEYAGQCACVWLPREAEHTNVDADLAEEALRASEGRIDDMELVDLIDVERVQSLVDDLYSLTHIPNAIIGLQGKVLVGAGWQDICTRFHRQHAETVDLARRAGATDMAASPRPKEMAASTARRGCSPASDPIAAR